ncbi:MAG TPA: NAD-dependent epimerase/dehydratase family protein [Nitrososphaera sp.]|nr:NAD-dependent epimerase/dehydratase family protein [Nitrososphaera sp.]
MESFEGFRVLVTGATGFIGSRLVERLLASSGAVSVTSLVRPPAAAKAHIGGRAEAVVGDLTDKTSLKFNGKYDHVYHLASLTPLERKKERLRAVNYEGTRNLFDSIKDKADSFVYVSGLAAFSPTGGADGVIDENSPKNPGLDFVKIRLQAEQFLRESCKAAGIDFTVVYFPDIVYGNGGYFTSVFLEPISKGKFRIPGSGNYFKNFIHRDDATDILITIAEKAATNQSYIATDCYPAPFAEFVNFIADQLGAKHPGSAPALLAKMAVGSEVIEMLTTSNRASNEKIRKIYEFKYPSYREGIPEVVSEFKSG